MKQISFHGKQENKDAVLAEIATHEKADMYTKGSYWLEEKQKGCAVGCLLKSGNHIEYEERFGIPKWLARLEDAVFEGLSVEESKLWPRRFMEAVPVGEDDKYFNAVFRYIAVKRIDSLPLTADQNTHDVVAAIRQLHVSNEQDEAAWSAARSAAWSAARSAVWPAARSAADSAARSAADSAARSAARSAAWSAARPAARSAAESAAYTTESNILIEALNMSYDKLTSVFREG